MWGTRIDAMIVTCESENIAKQTLKYLKRGRTPEWITIKLGKNNPLAIDFAEDIYSKGDNDIIDATTWKEGIGPIRYLDGKFKFVQINNILNSQPKKINEARGAITSDYQAYLEANWVKDLRKKYTYKVNYNVLLEKNSPKKTQKATVKKESNENMFDFKGTLVPIYFGSFEEAFKQGREKLGRDKVFSWNNKAYHTNYKIEIK